MTVSLICPFTRDARCYSHRETSISGISPRSVTAIRKRQRSDCAKPNVSKAKPHQLLADLLGALKPPSLCFAWLQPVNQRPSSVLGDRGIRTSITGSSPGRVKTMTLKIDTCCFQASHSALLRDGKDWFVQCQDYVTE